MVTVGVDDKTQARQCPISGARASYVLRWRTGSNQSWDSRSADTPRQDSAGHRHWNHEVGRSSDANHPKSPLPASARADN